MSNDIVYRMGYMKYLNLRRATHAIYFTDAFSCTIREISYIPRKTSGDVLSQKSQSG